MGQKSGDGFSNSKAMANAPSCDLRTPTTRQGTFAPPAALRSQILWPFGNLMLISSKPPWTLTVSVNASIETSFPSSSCVSRSKWICSKTRSLLRRDAVSDRGLNVLQQCRGLT